MIRIYDESKRSKYKIFVDYNIVKIGKYLESLGYSVDIFSGDISDEDINKNLNSIRKSTKEKPIIFITKNYIDFEEFDKSYHTLWIKNHDIDEKKASEKIRQIFITNNDTKSFPDSFVTIVK